MFVKDVFFYKVYLYLFISRILVLEICRILNILNRFDKIVIKSKLKGFFFVNKIY